MHAIESKAQPLPPEPTMRQERTVQATIFEVFAGHEIGWYDHVTGPIVNASATGNISGQNDTDTNANDSLIPVLPLSTSVTPANPVNIPTSGVCGTPGTGALAARCGYGPRPPFLVISPWAKTKFCRSHVDRPDLEFAIHRGKLGAGEHRRIREARRPGLVRPIGGNDKQYVRLREQTQLPQAHFSTPLAGGWFPTNRDSLWRVSPPAMA